ncbi:MAG: ASCH domain-containing protein [Paracoccus sp. (in: a-proteobacteria)]|uniref:ASCH domain-containing protein n=1 Tax=Paracoccus sp. TaxID=267 RepID=UPI0026E0215B|nr:ASCH domain-containing protein [Paracoccus sp. (in: a-proteobacteria)]MDO5613941.1 ASCH domain-containing protein [Paracoccus sp. (in: a-proteobacteria)]
MPLAVRWPGARFCDFGDSADLSAHLLGLIRAGVKTATCGALRDYQAAGDPVPRAGDVMIARDHAGRPALVYELTEVVVRPFCEVPEDFALAEGEGDFAAWRAGHQAYFARNGGFAPDMPLVCERFRLVEVLA